tara:strand:+ start:150 stop:326 length:177 start_codon:yes stop_codon:yes gene_type:complete
MSEHMISISDKQAEDVLLIRKLEVLLDVLAALDTSNAPELYGVKITVIDKIERAVSKL